MKSKASNLLRVLLVLAVLAVFVIFSVTLRSLFVGGETEYGVTFSTRYAKELDLDWREAYTAVLDELGAKKLRVPVYWSEVEPRPDEFDFSEVDWMMDEAEKRGAKVTLVVGVKVPRWPECFIPDWAESEQPVYLQQDTNDYIRTSVSRYRTHPALERWQVENEFFLPFGICPQPNPKSLGREIGLVRTLDPLHPVQLTASGEQAFWAYRAVRADVLGVSMYQRAWNPVYGWSFMPITAEIYGMQRLTAGLFADRVIVSELQAEPWVPPFWDRTDPDLVPIFYKLFSAQDVQGQADLAQRSGFTEVYFWGVEWWYYLKEQGEDRLWKKGMEIFRTHP